MIKTYCGVDCCSQCPRLPECGGCEICQGHPFGGSCVAQRNRDFPALKKRLIEEINALQIKGLSVCNLNLLNGAYVNLEYPLVNGSSVRFLKDEDIYFGNQIEREESERCFGVVADESFILVCEYGCNGADPEIVLYKRREDNYVCRIASLEEVNERWDTLIREHPEDPNWAVWKTDVLAEVSAGKEIPYYGFLGGEIICEAYAIPNYTPGEDDKGYREDGTAYLSAFRTVKAYRGKGFFSKLLHFMLNDLRKKGFARAILGVEPDEVLNKQMYLHWGFTEKVYTGTCTYPDGTTIAVEYFMKTLSIHF